MKYLVDNKYLPKDISNSLIFTTNGLQRLRRRIAELRDEKSKLHKDYKALTKSHDALMGELNEKRSLIDVEKKVPLIMIHITVCPYHLIVYK
jgi:predicted nuclease with TOPRIM domain